MVLTPAIIVYAIGAIAAYPYARRFKRMFDRDMDMADLRQQERTLDQANALLKRVADKSEDNEYTHSLDDIKNAAESGIFHKPTKKRGTKDVS